LLGNRNRAGHHLVDVIRRRRHDVVPIARSLGVDVSRKLGRRSQSSSNGRSLIALDLAGFRLRDTVYDPALEIPPQPHAWAGLCLAVEGGYVEVWGQTHMNCGPGSLVFHPPDHVYGDRISEVGSHCFTVDIAPEAWRAVGDAVPALGRLQAPRSAPPNWLAFRLHAELELGDDLSAVSIESAVFELLAELAGRPALEGRGIPPLWLERVRERIHDEFTSTPTLAALAETAEVHRVHLARAFRRHYGCTVGDISVSGGSSSRATGSRPLVTGSRILHSTPDLLTKVTSPTLSGGWWV
jgi:AraC family transcriptional regulator